MSAGNRVIGLPVEKLVHKRKPVMENTNPGKERDQADESKSVAHGPALAKPKEHPAQTHEGDTTTNHNPAKPKPHWVEVATFVLEFIGLGGLLWYAWSAHGQLEETIRFNKEAVAAFEAGRKQTAEALRIASESLEISRRAADASVKQAEVAGTALVIGQRAWIQLADMDKLSRLPSEANIRITAIFRNAGHAPASKVSVIGASQIQDAKSPIPDNYFATVKPPTDIQRKPVGAGEQLRVWIDIPQQTPQVIDAIRFGRVRVYALARVSYRDGIRPDLLRHTDVCAYYDPPNGGEWITCSNNNRMD